MIFIGPVRPESFTLIYGRNEVVTNRGPTPTECQPTKESLEEQDDDDDETLEVESILPPEKEADLLRKLANKHYYR